MHRTKDFGGKSAEKSRHGPSLQGPSCRILVSIVILRWYTLLVGPCLGVQCLLLVLLLLLLMHDQIIKPRVLKSVMGTNSQFRTQLQHSLQQVDPHRVDGLEDVTEVLSGIHLEGRLIVWKLCDAGPSALSGRAHNAEYPDNLVLVGSAWEERAAGIHLSHDAPCGPYVDAGVIRPAAEQDVGSAIPQGDDFVGKGIDGDAECSCQTKISQFQ
uniref:Uncharacterized protein n=1 Tax=Photinus pyralis TaxID=7054 RepID=A0A1Y1KSA0_PHOPY